MQNYNDNKASRGVCVLCFFLPILAIILYFANIKTNPVKAKTYCKFGVIGIWTGIIGGLLMCFAIMVTGLL